MLMQKAVTYQYLLKGAGRNCALQHVEIFVSGISFLLCHVVTWTMVFSLAVQVVNKLLQESLANKRLQNQSHRLLEEEALHNPQACTPMLI